MHKNRKYTEARTYDFAYVPQNIVGVMIYCKTLHGGMTRDAFPASTTLEAIREKYPGATVHIGRQIVVTTIQDALDALHAPKAKPKKAKKDAKKTVSLKDQLLKRKVTQKVKNGLTPHCTEYVGF